MQSIKTGLSSGSVGGKEVLGLDVQSAVAKCLTAFCISNLDFETIARILIKPVLSEA